jgi:hypothetical protein
MYIYFSLRLLLDHSASTYFFYLPVYLQSTQHNTSIK